MKIDIETTSEHKALLDYAIAMTKKYLRQMSNDSIYDDILEELEEMHTVLYIEKRLPEFDEYELTSIGAIAVKNFEDEDPEYAKCLTKLDYYYEHYSDLEDR